MKYPVAMIPYANAAPYRSAGTPEGCTFVDISPRKSIAALQKAEVWGAAVPIGGLAKLKGQVDFLGNFGIAARGISRSVLFFSKNPFEKINKDSSIHLTSQSVSSVMLLYLLLGYRNGFHNLPCVVAEDEPADGDLMIGDEALFRGFASYNKNADDEFAKRYPHVTDLATEWYDIYNCSFVFARWVIRKDAPHSVHVAMLEWLEQFSAREDEFILRSAGAEADRLNIPEQEMVSYLRTIRRVLDDEDIKGQTIFLEELKQKARMPLFRPNNPGCKKNEAGIVKETLA